MYALTFWQPWAYATLALGRRVDNRTWGPPDFLLGRQLAIYAGGIFEHGAFLKLREAGHLLPSVDELPNGYLVGVATVSGVAETLEEAVVKQGTCARAWWEGPRGWLLSNVRAAKEPIRCKGKQGLWTLPKCLATALKEEL
jgi:hypothetical protein